MSQPDLTDRQQRLLDAIRSHIADKGYPPSVREMGAKCGLATVSAVAYQLGQLVEKGYIRRDRRIPRGVVVLDREAV